MPVSAHIRWRTAEIGEPGLPDHVAAGSWWNGVVTGTLSSYAITNLDYAKLYEVQVSAESPMGRSEWSAAVMGKMVRESGDGSGDMGQSAAAGPVTLPENLSVTMSKGDYMTDTGLTTVVTVSGDCPPNGGGLRVHVKRAGEEWSTEDTVMQNAIPPEATMNLTMTCGDPDGDRDLLEVSELSVDVIAPG